MAGITRGYYDLCVMKYVIWCYEILMVPGSSVCRLLLFFSMVYGIGANWRIKESNANASSTVTGSSDAYIVCCMMQAIVQVFECKLGLHNCIVLDRSPLTPKQLSIVYSLRSQFWRTGSGEFRMTNLVSKDFNWCQSTSNLFSFWISKQNQD